MPINSEGSGPIFDLQQLIWFENFAQLIEECP